MTRAYNLHPATFDEWFAGLDDLPPHQRPGQWAVNTLPKGVYGAVSGTLRDAFFVDARLPDLIEYVRLWWDVMDADRDCVDTRLMVWMASRQALPSVLQNDADVVLEDSMEVPPESLALFDFLSAGTEAALGRRQGKLRALRDCDDFGLIPVDQDGGLHVPD